MYARHARNQVSQAVAGFKGEEYKNRENLPLISARTSAQRSRAILGTIKTPSPSQRLHFFTGNQYQPPIIHGNARAIDPDAMPKLIKWPLIPGTDVIWHPDDIKGAVRAIYPELHPRSNDIMFDVVYHDPEALPIRPPCPGKKKPNDPYSEAKYFARIPDSGRCQKSTLTSAKWRRPRSPKAETKNGSSESLRQKAMAVLRRRKDRVRENQAPAEPPSEAPQENPSDIWSRGMDKIRKTCSF